MHQTTHFFNLGYGWLCKHCSAEAAERKHQELRHHGVAKSSPPALAKWVEQQEWRGLVCPRCHIQERLNR